MPTSTATSENTLFQSERHPLVTTEHNSPEEFVLSLIHLKAYEFAASQAVGLRVLDVGCNNGYGTATIAAACAQITGVDVSASAIEAARETHAGENVTYLNVDGGDLPFAGGSFDLVTSFQVVEHVDDVERFASEIKRVLALDGRALLTTPNGSLRLNPGLPPWNEFHVREFAPQELDEALSSVFPSVAIRGLFAPSELGSIEVERLKRARAHQVRERQAKRRFRRALKTLLPAAAAAVVRSAVGKRTEPSEHDPSDDRLAVEALADRWSTDDLSYRLLPVAADPPLDLLADCTMKPVEPSPGES